MWNPGGASRPAMGVWWPAASGVAGPRRIGSQARARVGDARIVPGAGETRIVESGRQPALPAPSSFGMCRIMYTPWPSTNTSVSPISPNSLKFTQVSVSKL